MPKWNDLSDAERQEIIDAVMHDPTWDAQIAIDVYNRIRRLMQARSGNQ